MILRDARSKWRTDSFLCVLCVSVVKKNLWDASIFPVANNYDNPLRGGTIFENLFWDAKSDPGSDRIPIGALANC